MIRAKIVPNRIVRSGGLKIGLFGVTLSVPSYADIVSDPLKIACKEIEVLRARGADVVVALTHLSFRDDLDLLGLDRDGKELPASSRPCRSTPDVVIGGHDHNNMALPAGSPRLFKADAEAETVWVVEIEKAGGVVNVKGRLVKLDESRPEDPAVRARANEWLKKHDAAFCKAECTSAPSEKRQACLAAAADGACLKETFVRAASMIETEEDANRSKETGFGNWLADRMRQAGNADVSVLNSGSIRINFNIPANTLLTRRHLQQIVPFDGKLVVRDVPAGDLWRAMQYSVSKRGQGSWPHFSGMAMRLGGARSEKIETLLVRRRDGSILPINAQSDVRIRVASIAYVFANHRFNICPGVANHQCMIALDAAPGWPVADNSATLAGLMRKSLREIPSGRGLELPIDRRLCDRGHSGCLFTRWLEAGR